MTSTMFEDIAKRAVITVMKEKYEIDVHYEDLQLVWFAHELGNKKCTLYAPALGNYYPEVTYNKDRDELYIDVYLKKSNTVMLPLEFNTLK